MNRTLAASAAINRPVLFFWLFLLAAGNKLIGVAITTVAQNGLARAAFDLFGISLILWVAVAAGLALVRRAAVEPIRPRDLPIATVVVAAAILPVPGLSAVVLTLLAAYTTVTSKADSELRRGALVFLSTTSSMIWGATFLEMFSGPLLGADAYIVGQIAGAAQTGNQLSFVDGSGTFVIVPGCSSFHSMSLALIFWVTVNQWFRVPFDRKAVLWGLAAIAATMAVNAARLTLIAWFPAHFELIHSGWGVPVIGWTTLFLIVTIVLYGARREVFAKL